MSNAIIRSAIESRLANWTAQRSIVLPIAYENVSFDPPPTAYLAAYMLPATTTSDDLSGDHRGYKGVYQINVVTPIGTGPGQANGIADEISELFSVNLRISKSGLIVQVMTPVSQSTASTDATTYSLPLSFSYRADIII